MMIALLLAGGFAKRLGPIGTQLPKPLLMVEGDRAINHLIRKIKKAGIDKIYITVNQKFVSFFREYPNVIVEPTTREEEKLGAVSAIANAIEELKIDDDLLVVCTDNYFSSDFDEFVKSFSGEPQVGFYYAGNAPDLKPEEMATAKFEGSNTYPPPSRTFQVKEFKEKVKPPLSKYVGTGIYLLPRRVLPVLLDFCKGKKRDAPGYFIQHLASLGEPIKGYLFEGEWYDISHRTYWDAFRTGELARSDDTCVKAFRKVGSLEVSITILKAKRSLELSPGSVHMVVEGRGVLKHGERKRTLWPRDVVVLDSEVAILTNSTSLDLVFLSVSPQAGEQSEIR